MPSKNRKHIIIHSDCYGDINKAKKNNVWASTPKGNDTLKGLFEKNSIVYLYFTKYKSKKFCGVAKMKTIPKKRAKRGYWAKDIYGKTFALEWLNTSKKIEIPPPYVDKVLDTSEIDEDAGKILLTKFVNKKMAKDTILMKYLDANPITGYFSAK